MAHPISVEDDRPSIPKRTTSWFVQLLMALAVLVLAALVYGFWRMAQAPSPNLELPDVAPATRPQTTLPTNEQAP